MKKFKIFYIALGSIGYSLMGITVVVILIQYKIEFNPIMSMFCAVSWLLFLFAAYGTVKAERELYSDAGQISIDVLEETEKGRSDQEAEITGVRREIR